MGKRSVGRPAACQRGLQERRTMLAGTKETRLISNSGWIQATDDDYNLESTSTFLKNGKAQNHEQKK